MGALPDLHRASRLGCGADHLHRPGHPLHPVPQRADGQAGGRQPIHRCSGSPDSPRGCRGVHVPPRRRRPADHEACPGSRRRRSGDGAGPVAAAACGPPHGRRLPSPRDGLGRWTRCLYIPWGVVPSPHSRPAGHRDRRMVHHRRCPRRPRLGRGPSHGSSVARPMGPDLVRQPSGAGCRGARPALVPAERVVDRHRRHRTDLLGRMADLRDRCQGTRERTVLGAAPGLGARPA